MNFRDLPNNKNFYDDQGSHFKKIDYQTALALATDAQTVRNTHHTFKPAEEVFTTKQEQTA